MAKSRGWQFFYQGQGDDLQIWQDHSGSLRFGLEERLPFEISEALTPWIPLKAEEKVRSWHQQSWENQKRKRTEGKWVFLKDLTVVPREEAACLCHSLGSFWGAFGDSPEQNVLLPQKMAKNLQGPLSRVTFFGGSFNPWHRGHRECLNLCAEDEIMVVPDCNPWKKE